jgi:hypothetical protein
VSSIGKGWAKLSPISNFFPILPLFLSYPTHIPPHPTTIPNAYTVWKWRGSSEGGVKVVMVVVLSYLAIPICTMVHDQSRSIGTFAESLSVELSRLHRMTSLLRQTSFSNAPNRGGRAGAGRLATKTAGATSQVESVECSPHPPRTDHGLTHQARLPLWGVVRRAG